MPADKQLDEPKRGRTKPTHWNK